MDALIKLKHNYSGTVFHGIIPQEIEFYIFKILWQMKIVKFNKMFLTMVIGLKDLNMPLTENCDMINALDLYETNTAFALLESMVTSYQKKKITSPYKWWNTRLPLDYIFRQIYVINDQIQNYDDNWYYQEDYKISVPRFYHLHIERHFMNTLDYKNTKNSTQFIKRYSNIELTDNDWSNRGINNRDHSIYPEEFRKQKVIYHFNLEEEYPPDYSTICYFC